MTWLVIVAVGVIREKDVNEEAHKIIYAKHLDKPCRPISAFLSKIKLFFGLFGMIFLYNKVQKLAHTNLLPVE